MIEFKIIFWITLAVIFYTYLGYFLFLFIISLFRKREYSFDENFLPHVSMVIAAYNEEKVIEEKIKNCFALDYPEEKIEFLIGSDGSNDSTNEIVEKYTGQRLKFYPNLTKRGKVSVVNDLLDEAKGEIIVFSDANTIYEKTAVKNLTGFFVNKEVGGVSGELKLSRYKSGSSTDEIKYWNFENRLKELESNFNSVIGATGGIYAIRKNLCEKLPENRLLTHDFFTSMNVLKKGFKFIYSKNAAASEYSSPRISDEFIRKIRIAFHNFNGLSYIIGLLNPFKGLVSFQLWSHKVLRWFLPFIFILNFLVSFILLQDLIYKIVFFSYTGFMILGILGLIFEKSGKYFLVFSLPYYLITVNLALVIGYFRYIFKLDKNVWKRVER
ncbi:glycosyltransferase family 2 protein [candidate division KSB1 bacterium]